MQSFQNSIEQLLWPEKRDKDQILGDNVPGVIDRTTGKSYLRIPKGYLPEFLQDVSELQLLPDLFKETGLELGPIPAGTPVNLLANLNVLPDDPGIIEQFTHKGELVTAVIRIRRALKELPADASDEEARRVFREKDVIEPLLELSKCPDMVVNRGHYFGTEKFKETDEPGLSDPDKRALVEFLKTF
jgi:hypothetical protein